MTFSLRGFFSRSLHCLDFDLDFDLLPDEHAACFERLVPAQPEVVGLAMLPAHLCIEALRKKELIRVLPDWCSTPVPIQLVYSSARLMAPVLKAYVEHLREHMTPAPWEVGPMP